MSNKLSPEIFNAIADNLTKLADLFPSAVKDGQLDIYALCEELGQFEEVGVEKYELIWSGKQAAKKLSQTDVTGRTLKYIPEDSKDADTTQNLYIEGDNLEVLKLLRQNYYGVIKMIYIDPPYNTGNDFVYRDDFSMNEKMSDEAEGDIVGEERMVVNQKSGNRYHANWLNMIYPRLRVAKDLLCEDGVIFISIDDNEISQLRRICDEIFGEPCFVADVSWQRTYSPRNDSKSVSDEKEHLIVYSKFPDWTPNRLPRTEKMDSKYKNPDNDVSLWRTSDAFAPGAVTHQGMVYAIQHPLTGDLIYPYKGACWPLKQSEMLEIMQGWGKYILKDLDDADMRAEVCGIQESEVRSGVMGIVLDESISAAKEYAQEVYDRGRWPRFFFTKKGLGGIARKTYLNDTDGRVVTNLWLHHEVGHTDEAKKEIKLLFNENAPFDTPKPTRLIDRMLTISTDRDSTILDFFSGSATTAHAAMKKNAEDNGNRKFILVQLPEESASVEYKTLCDIGKERIRRAGEKIKTDIESNNTQLIIGETPKQIPDIGFRVFRVADTNIRWTNEALNDGQITLSEAGLSENDKLDFMPDYTDIDVVYEIMLRQRDIPLSSNINKLDVGKRTYMFANAYIVCLDESVTVDLVESLATIEPTPIKYVFRDSAFDDNISLKDETIRRLEAYVARNSGEQKKAFTVEFI